MKKRYLTLTMLLCLVLVMTAAFTLTVNAKVKAPDIPLSVGKTEDKDIYVNIADNSINNTTEYDVEYTVFEAGKNQYEYIWTTVNKGSYFTGVAGTVYLVRYDGASFSKAVPVGIEDAVTKAEINDLVYPTNLTLAKDTTYAVTATAKVPGVGAITVEYSADNGNTWSTTAPTTAGTFRVRLNIADGTVFPGAVLYYDGFTVTKPFYTEAEFNAAEEEDYVYTYLDLVAGGDLQEGIPTVGGRYILNKTLPEDDYHKQTTVTNDNYVIEEGWTVPTIEVDSYFYDGKAHVYTEADFKGRFDAETMTFDGDLSATDAGDYTITFTLPEGYTFAEGEGVDGGIATITWKILPLDLSNTDTANGPVATISFATVTFNNLDQTAVLTDYFSIATADGGKVEIGDNAVILDGDGVAVDSVVQKNAGTYTYTIAAKDGAKNFTGSKEVTFTIDKLNVNNLTFTFGNDTAITASAFPAAIEYLDNCPTIGAHFMVGSAKQTVSADDFAVVYKIGDYVVTTPLTPAGVDYAVYVEAAKDSNYTGSKFVYNQTVNKRDISTWSDLTVVISDATFNFAAQSPSLTSAKVGAIDFASHFELAALSATDAGKYNVTISAKSISALFTGSKELVGAFEIAPLSLATTGITAVSTTNDLVYNGAEQTVSFSAITIKSGDNTDAYTAATLANLDIRDANGNTVEDDPDIFKVKDAGDYKYYIFGTEGSNYLPYDKDEENVGLEITVNVKKAQAVTVEIPQDLSLVFNNANQGSAVSATVYVGSGAAKVAVPDTLYDVTFERKLTSETTYTTVAETDKWYAVGTGNVAYNYRVKVALDDDLDNFEDNVVAYSSDFAVNKFNIATATGYTYKLVWTADADKVLQYQGADVNVASVVDGVEIYDADDKLFYTLSKTASEYTLSATALNPGDYYAAVTGKGNFEGMLTGDATNGLFKFTVKKYDLNNTTLGNKLVSYTPGSPKKVVYDRAGQSRTIGKLTVNVSGSNKTIVLTESNNYKIKYYDADDTYLGDDELPIDVGTYNAVIEFADTDPYFIGSAKINYFLEVTAYNITNKAVADIDNTVKDYAQSLIDITVNYVRLTDSAILLGEETKYDLVADTDYTVSYDNNTDAGEHVMTFTGIGNFTGAVTVNIEIARADITNARVEFKDQLVYNGQSQKQLISKIILTNKQGKEVVITGDALNSFYFLSDSAKNAGSYEMIIISKEDSNFTGVITRAFTINPKNIADFAESAVTVTPSAELVYTGRGQYQKIASVTVDGFAGNVTVTATNNFGTNAGDYNMTITGYGNFCGTRQAMFTIAPMTLTADDVVVTLGDQLYYNGKVQTQRVQNIVTKDGLPVTFTVSGNSASEAGAHNLTIAANGNFTGEFTAEYSILSDSIDGAVVTLGDDLVYNGKEQEMKVVSVVVNGKKLAASEYTVSGNKATDAGSYELTITPVTDKYVGSVTVAYKIAKANLSDAVILLGDKLTYNGKVQYQTVKSVTIDGADFTSLVTVTNNDAMNVGTYTLTVSGNKNINGFRNVEFKVYPCDIANAVITVENDGVGYDGSIKTAKITSVKIGDMYLVEGDYIVLQNTAVDVGDHNVIIQGVGNFTGIAKKGFTIDPAAIDEKDIEIVLGDALTYNGSVQTQTVKSVKYKGENVAYTVSGNTAKNVGKYQLVVTVTGIHAGTFTVDYEIAALDITDIATIVAVDEFDYDGEAHVSEVEVNLEGFEDFTYEIVADEDATDAGVYEISAVANGNFKGTVSTRYEIKALDIADAVVVIKDLVYTGKELTLEFISVKVGDFDATYTVETDFTANAGEYTFTLTGNGNFKGEYTGTAVVEQIDISDATLNFVPGEILAFTGKKELTKAVVKIGESVVTATVTAESTETLGVYNITVVANGNFKGTKTFEYSEDVVDITNATVELGNALTYNGKAQTQTIASVKLGDIVLTADDYTVEDNEAKNVGNYTLIITGKGNYTGSVEVEFTVNKADLSKATVKLGDALHFNTKTQKQTISSVKVGDVVLTADDYTVTGNEGRLPGDYTMTLTGKGNFTGTIDVVFNISKTGYSDVTTDPLIH